MGHEVRELKSSRLTISITEQLKQEQLIRQNTEHDFTEMESILKKRILFLEQYKAAVGLKMVKTSRICRVKILNDFNIFILIFL